MEVLKKLREQRGEFAVRFSVGLLIFLLVFNLGFSFWHVYHVLDRVRETVNESVLAVAAVNVAEFYGGARESDGYARHPEGGSFAFLIDTDDVISTLSRSVGATQIAADGTITVGSSYVIKNISTQYENTVGSTLNFTTTITVVVPLDLGNVDIPIEKTIKVRSSYDTKF